MTKSIFAGLAALLLFSACQKDESIAADPARVDISILSPTPGAVFRNGDTVHIRARVGYPGQLHGYEIRLTDSATGSTIHDITEHVHSDTFDIAHDWVAAASRPMSVNLTLITTIDHDGNDARKSVSLKLLP